MRGGCQHLEMINRYVPRVCLCVGVCMYVCIIHTLLQCMYVCVKLVVMVVDHGEGDDIG